MTFMKSTIAALFLGLSATAAQAAYTCEVHSYGHGLSATRGNHDRRMDIMKSWIPAKFTVNEQSLTFLDWDPIDVRSYTDSRIRATARLKDENGGNHRLDYDIIVKQNAADNTIAARVTMRERGYKPLGPVIFFCTQS